MRQLIVLLFCVAVIGIYGNQVNGGPLDSQPGSTPFPSDEEELAQLKKEDMAFSDFCISSRNQVTSDLRRRSAELAELVVYGQGMTSGSRAVFERASLKLFGQLENPNAPIDGLFANIPYDSIIAEGMGKIQQSKSYSDSYMLALRYIWLAYSSYAKDDLGTKVREAKSAEEMAAVYKDHDNDRTNMASYISEIQNEFQKIQSELESKNQSDVQVNINASKQACYKFNEYRNEMGKLFDKLKAKLVAIDESLAKVTLDNVGCLTTRRVLNAVAVCNFMETAKQPITRILKEDAKQ